MPSRLIDGSDRVAQFGKHESSKGPATKKGGLTPFHTPLLTAQLKPSGVLDGRSWTAPKGLRC